MVFFSKRFFKNIPFESRLFLLGLGIISLLALLAPLLFMPFISSPLTFNQHYIEFFDKSYRAATFTDDVHSSLSYYTFAANNFFNKQTHSNPDFQKPEQVFDYVFTALPYYSIVYPTEMYYYYRFPLDGTEVSGNLRLVELINGNLSIGYFDVSNQAYSESRMFGLEDGLKVTQLSDTLYSVYYNGKRVLFKLSSLWDDYPSRTVLMPDETFVTTVRDESGVIFHLLFNEASHSFYYVLDEERVLTDSLKAVNPEISLGNRTGFAYYHDDYGRMILFGINASNVQMNTYFDGPFDQVYPFLDLRDKIYAAYPYTQFGGVDIHGNFLNVEGMRVAISPYFYYEDEQSLEDFISACASISGSSNSFVACLTYEGKRDFHRDSPLFYPNGTKKLNPQDLGV